MIKKIGLLLVAALTSCTISNAQTSDPQLYDAGNGIYYMSYDTMRDLLPAFSSFKQQHKECKITSMTMVHGCPLCSFGLLINCDK